MDYALIENRTVVNLIFLHPMNAHEFPNAIPIEKLPVQIGDTYTDGVFYRDGKEVQNETAGISEQDVIDSILNEVSKEDY